jgi:hypothetical protein
MKSSVEEAAKLLVNNSNWKEIAILKKQFRNYN